MNTSIVLIATLCIFILLFILCLLYNKYAESFVDVASTTASSTINKDIITNAESAFSDANKAVTDANALVIQKKGIVDNISPKALEVSLEVAKQNWTNARQKIVDIEKAGSAYNNAISDLESAKVKSNTTATALSNAVIARATADSNYNAYKNIDYTKKPNIVDVKQKADAALNALGAKNVAEANQIIADYNRITTELTNNLNSKRAILNDRKFDVGKAYLNHNNTQADVCTQSGKGGCEKWTRVVGNDATRQAKTNAIAASNDAEVNFNNANSQLETYKTNNTPRFNDAVTTINQFDTWNAANNVLRNLMTNELNAYNTELNRLKGIADTAGRNVTTAAQNSTLAEANLKNAIATLDQRQKEYDGAKEALKSITVVYNNAMDAAAKRTDYNNALNQQTKANELLTKTKNALINATTTVRNNIDKTFTEDSAFIGNAAEFPNEKFGLLTKTGSPPLVSNKGSYNALTENWVAFTAAKTGLNGINASEVVVISTSTKQLIDDYNKFIGSKDIYGKAIIAALKSNNTESEYVTKSKNDIATYTLLYDITTQQREMENAWTQVTNALTKLNAAEVIPNYNKYVKAKAAYTNALLIAQNKKSEADFKTSLETGKANAANWLKSGAKGCRNLQTVASTNPNMLDQNITCGENEYIAGYSKVTGFDATPMDSKVSQDNITQYLAVKYSCCVAPTGAKGPKGKTGLPGLEGRPGVDGAKGADGPQGPKGPTGLTGDKGPDGKKGPAGEIGDKGDKGEIGSVGQKGISITMPTIKQVEGPIGPQGPQGPRGIQGPKGANGVIKQAPVRPSTELDKTVALMNIQDKINNKLRGTNNKRVYSLQEENSSIL